MGTSKSKEEVVESGDENEARGNWSGKLDFLLSAIGFAVGLGNIWRFPYRAYDNGGATFLIPYVIMLVTAGLPLFLLEMAFGQFASCGPISVWNAVPLFRGIGYAMVVISTLVCIYYNMIIAYTFFYLFASFTKELPWSKCQDDWVQYGCRERETNETLRNLTKTFCEESRRLNLTNTPQYLKDCTPGKTPSEIYWERVVLDQSECATCGTDEIRWQLALCLLLAWVVIFLCLSKGIKSSGKVVYVTATFPYIVLVILFIRNLMLPGAKKGIEFYVIPEWHRLKEAKVWGSAAIQIFYSLGVAFGGLATMSSYNKFHNNVYRDALLVAVINCATSVFAGFVIFSILGFMSDKTGVEVKDVAAAGPGLAFIAYPEGLAMMPVAPLWSILFFLMLFTLGLDSQFAMMETVISAIVDEVAWLREGKWRKTLFTLALCIGLFFLGLPCCSRAGIYVVNLFEWYSAGFSLMIVSLLEVLAISWIYGVNRFIDDVKMMIGFRLNYYWLVTWAVVTPIVLCFILIYSMINHEPVSYGDHVYADWVDGMGWLMVALAVVWIPVIALVEYCRAHGFIKVMRRVLRPNEKWGPALDQHRIGSKYSRGTDIQGKGYSSHVTDGHMFDGHVIDGHVAGDGNVNPAFENSKF